VIPICVYESDHNHFYVRNGVLYDFVIEQLNLSIVLLNLVFDLSMQILKVIKISLFAAYSIPLLISSVHNFIAKLYIFIQNHKK
jgi:hypothetical protein